MSGIYFNFLSKKMALGVRTRRMEEHHVRACVCVSVHVSVCVRAGWVSLYSSSWRSPQRQAGMIISGGATWRLHSVPTLFHGI